MSQEKEEEKLPEDDSDLFQQSLQGVRRLPPQNRIPPSRPVVRPYAPLATETQELDQDATATESAPILQPEQTQLYQHSPLSLATLKRLRQGKLCNGESLDLHALTATEAITRVRHWINHNHTTGKRCLLLIHGKGRHSRHGQPKLKSELDHWLRQQPEVLAFCSARQSDGGTGALYLLLHR